MVVAYDSMGRHQVRGLPSKPENCTRMADFRSSRGARTAFATSRTAQLRDSPGTTHPYSGYACGMSPLELARLATDALGLALWVSLPVLVTSAALGLVVALLQSTTQIQEPALQYVPKLVGIAFVLALTGAWMSGEIARFTERLWLLIPELLG